MNDPIPGCSTVIKDFMIQIIFNHYDSTQHWFGLRPPFSAIYMANIKVIVSLLSVLSQSVH